MGESKGHVALQCKPSLFALFTPRDEEGERERRHQQEGGRQGKTKVQKDHGRAEAQQKDVKQVGNGDSMA